MPDSRRSTDSTGSAAASVGSQATHQPDGKAGTPDTRDSTAAAGSIKLRHPDRTSARSLLRFVVSYVKTNFQVALEYRASFWAQVLAMIINDAMWIAFWGIFFQRFNLVSGYRFQDIVLVWSVTALAFGLTTGICGGGWRYAEQIAAGDLDFYLVLPKPVLLHVAVSRMSVSAWGDVLFAFAIFLTLGQPDLRTFLLFLLVTSAASVVILSYAIIVNAAAFWLGNADGLVRECTNALLIFSTYPSTLFHGAVKVLLFTAVPAGFVAYIPVELLRHWSWPLAAALAAAAVASALLATLIFQLGLRRYESGNLLAMRG